MLSMKSGWLSSRVRLPSGCVVSLQFTPSMYDGSQSLMPKRLLNLAVICGASRSDIAGVTVWAADCRGYYAHASGRVVTQWPHDMDEYLARTGTLRPECYESAPAGGGAPRFQMGGQAPQQPQQGYGGYGQQTQPTQGGFQPQGGYGQQQPPAQQPPAQQPAQGAGRFMPSFPRSPQAQRNPQFQAGGREQAMPTFGAQAQQQQQQQQSFGRGGGAQRGQMFQGQQQQEQQQPDPNRVPRDSDPREIPKPAERPPGAPPPVFRIGGDIGGSDPNDQSPRRFYNQGSLQGGGAQGDAGGGGGRGVSSFFNRGMAAAAQRMAAPRPTAMAAGRRGPLLTSVSLQYYYYFGVCWDVTFVLFTFVVMLWKGIKLPYPKYDYQTRDYESVWSIEFAFLFVFIMFEWPRMSLANRIEAIERLVLELRKAREQMVAVLEWGAPHTGALEPQASSG